MNSKRLIVMSMLMILAALVAACGGSESGTDGTETGETNADGAETENNEEVVVQVWGGGTFLEDGQPGDLVAQEFNEKYEGEIKMEVRYMPWDEFNTALQAAFSSNDVPDIFQLPSGVSHIQYASDDRIRPIDDIVSEDWKQLFYEGSFVDGKNVLGGETYGWPIQGPSLKMMLYYNKDVMEQAGLDPEQPPTTWDELRSMSQTVTDQGEGDVFGLIFGGSSPSHSYKTIAMGLAAGTNPEGLGSNDMFGFNYKTGEYELDSPALIDAVKFLNQLQNDEVIFPASYTMTGGEARTLFATGQAAFYISAYHSLMPIHEEGANFGVAPVPSRDGSQPYINYDVAYPGVSFVVSSQTENPEAVGKVIEEGIGSANYYSKIIESGTALAPMPELNNDTSLHSFPEFTAFAELTDEVMRAMPDPAARNPETSEVFVELGGNLAQPHVNPKLGELIQMYILGEDDNIEATLKERNDLLNQNLMDAIDKVNEEGVDVSHEDFIFPNWDPSQDYTTEDLEEIK